MGKVERKIQDFIGSSNIDALTIVSNVDGQPIKVLRGYLFEVTDDDDGVITPLEATLRSRGLLHHEENLVDIDADLTVNESDVTTDDGIIYNIFNDKDEANDPNEDDEHDYLFIVEG